jgi:hypothetical protein
VRPGSRHHRLLPHPVGKCRDELAGISKAVYRTLQDFLRVVDSTLRIGGITN